VDAQGGVFVRGIIAMALTLTLGACSFIDQIDFGGARLDPSKVYLDRETVTVAAREADRYACFGSPLLCVQHGSSFECRCP
jgi:hypothetical protein